MNIPKYQDITLPLLNYLSDNEAHKLRDAIDHICFKFNLTEEDRKPRLQSGKQPIIDNRIGWAKTYMKKAGLLIYPQRGSMQITDRGLQVLKEKPVKIDIKYLERFPEFVEFKTIKKNGDKEPDEEDNGDGKTPDELMEQGYNLIVADLAQDLLDKLRSVDAYFFEEIVGRFLTAMGYGKYEITKRSGDKGVDGIVYQDKLGLDKIFFQAKRYAEGNSVSAHDVRDFIGTLELQGANRGVFITTSKFPRDAEETIKMTSKNIVLINGVDLAKLMIEHSVGVSTEKIYKIKKIDTDFFIEE